MADSTDIWFPLYIGDYLASTMALSAEQTGAFVNLLVYQWRAGPLPADMETLRRIARVEKDTWAIVWRGLQPLFTRTVTGFVHERLAELKIQSQERQEEFSKRAQSAAKKRWSKNAASDAQALLEPCPGNAPSIPQAMPQQCPSPTPSSTETTREEEGDTQTQTSGPDGAGVVSAPALLCLWNAKCHEDLRVVKSTPTLTKNIRARIVDGLTGALLTQALDEIGKAPYLQGDNERAWKATLPWLMKDLDNVNKVVGGEYRPRKEGNGNTKGNGNRVREDIEGISAAFAVLQENGDNRDAVEADQGGLSRAKSAS